MEKENISGQQRVLSVGEFCGAKARRQNENDLEKLRRGYISLREYRTRKARREYDLMITQRTMELI